MSDPKASSDNGLAWFERASVCHRFWPSRNPSDAVHAVGAHPEREAQPRISVLRRLALVMFEQPTETLMANNIIRPERFNRIGRFVDADP